MRFNFILWAIVGSLFVSCASKNPGNTQNTDYAGEGKGEQLVLNGDSDSLKAGGLRTVYFDFQSSSISETAKEVLLKNANFLKANKKINVLIEGHCDERGGIQFNLALGERRAKMIKSYLKLLGVSEKRMSTVSYGKERPVEEGRTESSWGKNRRGNFVINSL